MPEIHAWLADKDGYWMQDLDAAGSVDDWPTFAKNAAANGQTAIDKTDPKAVRPSDRPLPPDPQQPKRDRLAVLRTQGWVNLSAAEKDEAEGLRFDLGV